MFPSFFDLTLKTWDSLTNHPRPNPIFLFKHLTQRVYADSISADTAPPGGWNQLIKIETLNAKGFRYSHPTVTKLVSFDCKFYPFSTPGFFSLVPVTVLSESTVWSRLWHFSTLLSRIWTITNFLKWVLILMPARWRSQRIRWRLRNSKLITRWPYLLENTVPVSKMKTQTWLKSEYQP